MLNTILPLTDVSRRQYVKEKLSTMKKQEPANAHRVLHSSMELAVSLVICQIIGTLKLSPVKAVLKVLSLILTMDHAKIVHLKHH